MFEKLPPPAGRDRPFPWRCVECREKQVYPQATDYTITVKHDGRPYEIHIPDLEIPTCRNCGEKVFGGKEDGRITDALREHVGLLKPGEIRRKREGLKLTQDALAEQLGVAKETISRWETGGVIQSRAMDKLLRLFFGCPPVREFLQQRTEGNNGSDPQSPPPERFEFRHNKEPVQVPKQDYLHSHCMN
jgi:putative zinc finger/helix-turn-helix YgiT family protein